MGRLAGELVERQRIDMVSAVFSTEWLKRRPLIVAALLPFPEAAAAVEAALCGADAGS